MKYLLAVFLLAFAFTAHADTIVDVSVTADFSGVEAIAVAFQYDATTDAMSGVSFSSSGPLGPFTYEGGFDWIDGENDLFQIYPDEYGASFGDPIFPDAGSYGEADIDLQCGSYVCINDLKTGIDFGNSYNSTASFIVTPVSTPEPSTLDSLAVGIGALGWMGLRKRRLIFD